MWCNVKIESINLTNENLYVCGTVIASIIAIDTDEMPSFYEKLIDFEYNCPINLKDTNLKCEPIITVFFWNAITNELKLT